jgi:uncharacterized membrane protein
MSTSQATSGHPRMHALLTSTAAAVAMAVSPLAFAATTLEYFNAPAGSFTSAAAYGCSGTGDVVAISTFASPDRAVRWTGGPSGLVLAPPNSAHDSFVRAVSADGSVLVGHSSWTSGSPASMRPVIWRGGLPPQDIGNLPGMLAGECTAVSATGVFVVGLCEPYPFSGTASGFRWSQTDGMVAIPGPTSGTAMRPADISDDGTVIVGDSLEVACRSVPNGASFLTQSLGVLPGMVWSRAQSVSSNGTVIVGKSYTSFDEKPFVWRAKSGMTELPTPAGIGWAFDVSDNGQTIVGDFGVSGARKAAAWADGLGFVDLNAYLDAAGVSRLGDTLALATGVSRDGRTIVGYTEGGRGFRIRGFNESPTELGDIDGDGDVDAGDLAILLASWGGSGAADVNGDGIVDGADLSILLGNWG